MITKDDKLIFRCLECKNNYQKDFNKDLINRFANTYKFCNKDINKIILLLRKEIDPGDYHDLYVKSDTFLFADAFENFSNKCIEIYELDTAHFLSAPGLAWQVCLRNTEVKFELVTDIDMLLMVEKGNRGGICHSIHRHAKANNNYVENYDKNKESSYLMHLDANNLYGWVMSQILPVGGFKWKKNIRKFDEDFIKNYDEDSDKEFILEEDVEYPKNLPNIHGHFPFLAEEL